MERKKDRPDSVVDAENNREMCRAWYDANAEKHKEAQRKWREENPDYYKKWRKENADWLRAKKRLRKACRPDRVKKYKLENYYPGLDASDVEFDEDIAEICDKIYKRKLKELRKIYGRDPETGRKISGNNN